MRKKRKILIIGMGPGETWLALAAAKYFLGRRWTVVMGLVQEVNRPFVKNLKTKIITIPTPGVLKKKVKHEKPDAIIYVSSKIWLKYKSFSRHNPFPDIPQFALDANWLFNLKRYPHFLYLTWVKKYLISIPPKIFKLGLKPSGGNFVLDPEVRSRIIPTGFLCPFAKLSLPKIRRVRKQYGVAMGEKMIFASFSGYGATHRNWAFTNLVSAVGKLLKRGYKIKVLYVGRLDNIAPGSLAREWLTVKKRLSAEEFFAALSSSDLVFEHQGQCTLAQAVFSQVPIIVNVGVKTDLEYGREFYNLHPYELSPFTRAGICRLLYRTTPICKIADNIRDLLYNKRAIAKIRQDQRRKFVSGEAKIYETIGNLVIR